MSDEYKVSETRPLHFDPRYTYETDHSWHWLENELASSPSIGEWMNGLWYVYDSGGGTVSPAEMWRRGWTWHSQVKVPRRIRDLHPVEGTQ